MQPLIDANSTPLKYITKWRGQSFDYNKPWLIAVAGVGS